MSGLPFPSKAESRLASIAVYSTKNNLRNVRIVDAQEDNDFGKRELEAMAIGQKILFR